MNARERIGATPSSRAFQRTTAGLRGLSLLALAGGLAGCAVHYYDRRTGTEHLWGFGHLKMKAAPADPDVRAHVTGRQALGLSLDTSEHDGGVALGWVNQRNLFVSEDTAVSLEWPRGSFFNVRVATNRPPEPDPSSEGGQRP
jgi:hypothetical protein